MAPDPTVELLRATTITRASLADVLAAFDELLLMPDQAAVVVALAGIVANYAEGDAVWPLLVGPPAGGKSEIISALTDAPGVWPLSSLTPQTLLSGFETKGDSPPASLLEQIGPFGILTLKDLTTILTMHREARGQILGQLREVADGRTEKSFGNGKRVEWEGKMGLVAGVTPVIDDQHVFLATMGERFLLLRLPKVDRRKSARLALERRGFERAMRQAIRTQVKDFLTPFQGCGRIELPPSWDEPMIALVDVVTRARSGVARDGYSRDLQYLPEPEAPTRLLKQLAQLGAAMLRMGVEPSEAWRLVRKAGWDSVPAIRTTIIDYLLEQTGPAETATLNEKLSLPKTTIDRTIDDLHVLDLLHRRKQDNGRITAEAHEDLRFGASETSEGAIPQVTPETSEGVQ
jgi:hypothetical protein